MNEFVAAPAVIEAPTLAPANTAAGQVGMRRLHLALARFAQNIHEMANWLPLTRWPNEATGAAVPTRMAAPVVPDATATQVQPPGQNNSASRVKGKNINARMLEIIQDKGYEVAGRSAQQWADALGCSKSSVIETQTWTSVLRVQRVAQGLKNKAKKSRRQ